MLRSRRLKQSRRSRYSVKLIMGRYRHVYRRSQQSRSSGVIASTQWEIRHPEHGRILKDVAGKHFSAELAAAKHLATKLFHVDVASLKTGVQVSRSRRKFKYIFWHAGRKRWVAKPPGLHMTTCDESGASFSSQEHAAKFVVKQLGLSSVKELMNPRQLTGPRKAKRLRLQESRESPSSGIRVQKRARLQESKACVQEEKACAQESREESCPVARCYKYVFWHVGEKKWVA